MLYISKQDALDAGLTHEGSLYGVPAWFAGVGDDEIFLATPKIPLLHAWCWLGEKLLDFGAFFISADYVLVSPINVKGPIK